MYINDKVKMKNLLLISIVLFANLIFAQTPTAPAVGDGSAGNPFQISTLDNLYWISAPDTEVPSPSQNYRFSYNYIQTEDIDASATLTWFPDGSGSYYGWLPIGDNSLNFIGNYDGQGHTISGLYINRLLNNIGFFGVTQNAYISNLGVINENIYGISLVGGLVGFNQSSLTNCFSTGSVNGFQYVGGLVGNNSNNLSLNTTLCYSSCNVSGGTTCGGLMGINGTVSVLNCYSTGDVIRLPGWTQTDFGAFVGQNSRGSLRYCYATGSVIYTGAANPTAKGFVSTNISGIYSSNFWDSESSSQSTTGGIVGQFATCKITSAMKTNATFLTAGWDNTIWNLDPAINNGYPYLKWQNPSGTPLPVELFSFTAIVSDGRAVKINWQTKTEINSSKFIIEIKSGNAAWAAVASVNASGQSNSPNYYSFTTKSLQADNYQFRLKMIDNNGSFQYSKIIETAISLPENFELSQNYPNPFNPSTKINYTLPFDSKVTLEVYNLSCTKIGQLVNEDQPAGYYTVDFNPSAINKTVSSGVYFYRITASSKIDGSNFCEVKKMILLK
jgi:hypothetical protein